MPGPWARFVENISSKLAFFPPDPPTYEFVEARSGHWGGAWLRTDHFSLIPGCEVFKLETKKRKGGGGGEVIVCCMMRQLHARKTLLYSHGNAVDLGQLQPFLRDLSEQLQVNIMSYDYSGYGRSTGMHTVNNTLADIDSVYECLQTKYRLQPKDIVLYGQSVGTGPSVDLAAREADVGGLILHSPLMSGVRVLSPGLRLWPNWADVYPNLTLMPKVKCVTTILHGTEDEVIAIEHGYKLHSLCKRPWGPLWLEGYNHQNLELSPQYLPHLRSFLAQLE